MSYRSASVLYEGGIYSKKQYDRKRSREIFEVDSMGKKHQVIAVLTVILLLTQVAQTK